MRGYEEMSDWLIASFPGMHEIGKKVSRALNGKHTGIFVKDFPDSEYHLALRKNPRGKRVVVINSITRDPDEKIVETILAGGVARDYGAKKVILIATYFPYMRQDKHFKKYDSFSSKYILKVFGNYDKIIAIDPHLHRIKKMRELNIRAESITASSLIADYIKKRFGTNFEIVGPDIESSQWGMKIAKVLGTKVVILRKKRFSAEKVKIKEKKLGKNVIIVDDVISTGKTVLETLKMAYKQGAKKMVVIGIHGVLAEGADKKIRKYAELITTNTIPGKYAKIDVSPAIVKALKRFR